MDRWHEVLTRLPISGVKQFLKTASRRDVADMLDTLAQAERDCVEKKIPFLYGMIDGEDYDEIIRTVRTLKKKWERQGLKQLNARKQHIANTGNSYEQPQEQQKTQTREVASQGKRAREETRRNRRDRRRGIRVQ